MNNKRILVIPVVAILATIITVAASLAFSRPAGRTQIIPLTGRSISGESLGDKIAQQPPAAFIDGKALWRNSVEENIRGQQSLPAYIDGKAQWRNSVEEDIRGQQSLPAYIDGKAQWRNSVEEYIRGQQ